MAGLFALQEAREQGVSGELIADYIPHLAGTVYVRFALEELAAGRCLQNAGTPVLNRKLWVALKSDDGKQMLEGRLPTPGLKTMRYVRFAPNGAQFSDVEEPEEGAVVIDLWSVARNMKRYLPGTLFYTHIA